MFHISELFEQPQPGSIIDPRWSHRRPPIIPNLSSADFYKFTMGQMIYHKHPRVRVTFRFKNRTKKVKLTDHIKIEDLRRELDHVRTLRFGNSELHYLRGTNEYGERMFKEDYLGFLRNLQLPEYELHYVGDEIELTFTAYWPEVTHWETISLSAVNELYYRSIMDTMTRAERDMIYAEGIAKLNRKIDVILQHPGLVISDFGTRRRFSYAWQRYVVQTLKERLPRTQFKGTSETSLANLLDLEPTGTNAHELPMVLAGLADSDEELYQTQRRVCDDWWGEYGEGLSIILPDTFGLEYVLKVLTREDALNWKGFRHDSGDPFWFGERVIEFYRSHGIDPREKLIVFSDGLDLETVLKLYHHFQGRIQVQAKIRTTYGIGTNLTNDLTDDPRFKPLSIVCKAVMANGRPLVKLSDNLAKATGPDDEVARYVRVFGYAQGTHENKTCLV